ncbi:uncharacterized protein B0T23DRAFT_402720 [Neurospora hispaniola]|uniref:Uncharacterized protein n=1 Tax=Neurospora hispaniola TaxID=588809 RepID=A0AAJ0ID95_9PEZI|nr:hypothetical protein B0T23DRAFT_402720 [Neurospora hispaniola]
MDYKKTGTKLVQSLVEEAEMAMIPLFKPGFMLKIALPDDGEESASASPALFASRKVRRHMCVLRVIGDPVIGHGPSSIEKKVGSCVARPKGRNSHDATTSAAKSPRAHPQQLVWPPTANIPRDIQGFDAKIDSQLNCGGKNEGLTVRCDCPPSML